MMNGNIWMHTSSFVWKNYKYLEMSYICVICVVVFMIYTPMCMCRKKEKEKRKLQGERTTDRNTRRWRGRKNACVGLAAVK